MLDQMNPQILIIEDDEELRKTIQALLESDGYSCHTAADGATGLQMAIQGGYELVILDLQLPGVKGMDVCKEIRRREIPCSILMLTARSEESDVIAGLSVGADDYVVKPFRPNELLARVQARLREQVARALRSMDASAPASSAVSSRDSLIRIGELSIDPTRREIRKRGELLPITSMEFDFLLLLAEEPGKVLPRSEFLQRLWKFEAEDYAVNVSVMASRIRRKLEDDPDNPRYLFTIRGVGYKLEDSQGR